MTAFRLHRKPRRKGARLVSGTKLDLYSFMVARTGGETASALSKGRLRDKRPDYVVEEMQRAAEAKRERRRARNLGGARAV